MFLTYSDTFHLHLNLLDIQKPRTLHQTHNWSNNHNLIFHSCLTSIPFSWFLNSALHKNKLVLKIHLLKSMRMDWQNRLPEIPNVVLEPVQKRFWLSFQIHLKVWQALNTLVPEYRNVPYLQSIMQ